MRRPRPRPFRRAAATGGVTALTALAVPAVLAPFTVLVGAPPAAAGAARSPAEPLTSPPAATARRAPVPVRLTFAVTNTNGPSGVAHRMPFGPTGLSVPVVGNWDRAVSHRDTVGVSAVDGTRRLWQLASGNADGTPAVRFSFRWGNAACMPVAGNWAGTGDTVGEACADRATRTWRWYLATGPLTSAVPGVYRTFSFGSSACVPVVGDWDGNGTTTVGVSCPSGTTRVWSLTNAHGDATHPPPVNLRFSWGTSSCLPVTGDWDGVHAAGADGVTVGQACVSRGNVWLWQLSNRNAAGTAQVSFTWGPTAETPVTGNWDGAATATRTNADTPGHAWGVNTPAAAWPAPDPYPPSEVTTGWTPRTQYTVNQITARFATRGCGGQATGVSSGHVPTSDHYTGNAADCFAAAAGSIATGADKALGDAMSAWLVLYGRLLKVRYIIWYSRIYDFETASPSWQPYCNYYVTAAQCAHPTAGSVATLQHMDHVHTSLLHSAGS